MVGIENIVVTDPDHVERSNLSRQFLFRSKDVGTSKAIKAAQAVQAMNPRVHIDTHELRFGFYDLIYCIRP